MGPCHHGMTLLRWRMEERPPMWRVAANILNKQLRTADKGWSTGLWLGEVLTTPHCRKRILLRNIHRVSFGPGLILLVRNKQRKRNTRFGTWNIRSLYRAGSLTAAARELAKYKIDLVGVQEVRCEKEGTVRAGDYNFFYGKSDKNHEFGTGFL